MNASGPNRRKKQPWDVHARHFTFVMQQNLLKNALAQWPRREAPLLEINCGDGAFLPVLWQYGFDLVATESDDDLRYKARNRNARCAQLLAAYDYDLPFENDEFDWVILHLASANSKTVAEAMQEALRVGKRGIMIAFWNKASLAGIFERSRFRKMCGEFLPLSWRQIWKIGLNMGAGRMSVMSTLNGPTVTWNPRSLFSRVNGWLEMVPLGAWCIIRIDIGPIYPLTSLPLRIRKNISPNEPVMEYGSENLRAKKPGA